MKVDKTASAAEKLESKYSKEQLLSTERYRGRRDAVSALLSSDKQYTFSDVDGLIEQYMKGQVK